MPGTARRERRAWAALAMLCAVAFPGIVRAQLSARLEPGYQNVWTRQTDQSGTTRTTEADSVLQRYRLNLDRVFGPELRLSAGGVLEDVRTWTSGDEDQFSGTTTSLLFANSTFGSNLLGGGAGYDWRRLDLHPGRQPALLNEVLRMSGHWRPLGLPEFSVQASRTNAFDADRASQDRTNDSLTAGLRYVPWRELDLRYSVRLSQLDDHLNGSEVRDVTQSGRATYADRYLDDRLSLYSSYSVNLARSSVRGGATGEILTQQFPVAGLSAIEALPDTVDRITLVPNPGLIDGQTGAGAALNIGFAPTLTGDVANRHAGVQLADRLTSVNRVYVYVDTPLPPELHAAYGWAAYRSDDNVEWTPLPIVGPVVYEPFQNRFEIPLAEVRASYVKVVVRPLAAGATTDPRFRNVFVSELQVFSATSPQAAGVDSTRMAGSLNTNVGYRILQAPTLDYNVTTFVRHGNDLGDYSYLVLNTLSAAHRLTRVLRISAQLQRSDENQSADEREVAYRYGTTLFADVLPTLSGSLAYSGSTGSFGGTDRQIDTVSALARAELYRGVDVFGTASRSYIDSDEAPSLESTTVNAGLSLVPHTRLTLSGGYALNSTSGGARLNRTQRVEGSAMLNPIGSVNLTAGVSRTFEGEQRNTLLNGSVTWSPLAGGALQLSLAYSQSLETASDSVQQFGSASARWSIRRGTFLDVGYSITDNDADVSQTQTRAFNAGLIISI